MNRDLIDFLKVIKDAKGASLDKTSRKLSLSIKALEFAEEKEAVEQYGSTDSGATW